MSVSLVKRAMTKFLADPTPAVLCIEGKWGTGKTFAWNDAVRTAVENNNMAITNYAYISLFGVKDASDILQSVYANTSDLKSELKNKKLPEKFGGFSIDDAWRKVKKLGTFAAEHATVPHVAGLGGVARAFLSNLVRDTVICIDDFERKSKNVTVNEVMGAITQLRDTRQCKVVLILNEDSLTADEKDEFRRYSEKVINALFQFEPTAEESASVAFKEEDSLSVLLKESVIELDIKNIRVMNKIEAYAKELSVLLRDIDPDVSRAAIRSLIVIVWTLLSPKGEGGPDIKYLTEKRGKQFVGIDRIEFSNDEIRWGVVLDRYGFSHCDDFDQVMIKGVSNGFFDDEQINKGIKTYLTDAEKAKARLAFDRAWAPFHGSFDNNVDEVATALHKGCTENVEYLSGMNLNAAVAILKDIGKPDLAHDLLGKFMQAHDGKAIFDRDEVVFGDHITDPDVVAAFDKKAAETPAILPTPQQAAAKIIAGGWNSEDEECLAKLSSADFIQLFKQTKGKERSTVVMGCVAFRKMGGTTDRQKGISEKAIEALITIKNESPLNAHRMKMFHLAELN